MSEDKKTTKRKKISLNWNLGVGTDGKPGYTGFDIKKTPCTDVVCDVTKDLPEEYKDKVENIIAFEILEHIEWRKYFDVLRYWISFLKIGGRLYLRVPDILEVVRQLRLGKLTIADWNRYLYGNQGDEYDYHKCGFTEEILVRTLEELGMEVEHTQRVFGTKMLYVTAVRRR